MNVRTHVVDGQAYIHAADMSTFLETSAKTVDAWCSDVAPLPTSIVVDTLNTTRVFIADIVGGAS